MATPVRFPSGFTQAAKFQTLGTMGQPNPLFYHTVYDDFDDFVAAKWTTTANGTAGTAPIPVAVNGGAIQFISGAVAASGYTITKPAASFQMTARTDAGTNPRTFFLTSISASAIATATGIFGLINTSTAPLTTAPTDGIWISLSGGTFSLNYAVGGVVATVVIPTSYYTLTNSTFVDIAIAINSQGVVLGGIGANTVGFVPNQGTAANPGPMMFPQARITPTVPLTAVLLNPTVSVATSTATAETVQVDFILAAQER